MLSFIKSATHILTCSLVLTTAAFAQSADITGWQDLPWGTKKPVVLKTLQSLHVRECPPNSKASCTQTAGRDGLVIDAYRFNAVSYQVALLFSAEGLSQVTMTAKDEKGALEKALAELTRLYGRPEFQSEYDGEREEILTQWIWRKAHGNVSLASVEGVFTITYATRRDRSRK